MHFDKICATNKYIFLYIPLNIKNLLSTYFKVRYIFIFAYVKRVCVKNHVFVVICTKIIPCMW